MFDSLVPSAYTLQLWAAGGCAVGAAWLLVRRGLAGPPGKSSCGGGCHGCPQSVVSRDAGTSAPAVVDLDLDFPARFHRSAESASR